MSSTESVNAGTGKSVLLREIIKVLKPVSPLKPSRPGSLSPEPSSLAVTASTGIAGLNIGGTTVHSFAGIRLGKEPAEKLAEAIKLSGRLRERWQKTRTLIIDESGLFLSTPQDK
jgi:ATP-dependent DNA helicase PIF1